MYGTELYVAIIIGAMLSLIYTEVTGILPAGLVVAGYIALMYSHPYTILVIFLISCIAYLIVTHGVARIVILYGRRKFLAMITVAVFITTLLGFMVPYLPYEFYQITGIGVIVPGIIANCIDRQGFVHTFISTVIVSSATFILLFGYQAIFL